MNSLLNPILWGKTLSSVLIFIDLWVGLCYALAYDWRRCIYWIAAAVLTATVTF